MNIIKRRKNKNVQNHEKKMKYITESSKQSKYSAIGHIQSGYLNWDSFVDCFP